ncbi:site-specific DNA-methyltransferase [Nonomuraea fuscirosea]|uniref:site-specific DNA-methyltransferase n=1 Tax=Nonomuraea fuscirosea TaxID=1291556 RepID=UPI0033DD0019
MKKITSGDPEFRSMDLTAVNLTQLKALFPEAFTEGKLNFEVLKQLLGEDVEEREEKYGLNWHGKRRARRLALTPSLGTLRPCPKESVDWDTTQNLMIEGDNLEVLKLLLKSYSGKVKLIYIDPPYNTGKDFVYSDDFRDNIKNYLQVTGQVDGNGHKLSTNTESSGRFHTDWLNMMYSRLHLARNLLTQDGFFLASIDDSEVANLKTVLDEVFGEENFITTLVFDKNRKNDARLFSVGHEYMLMYARNKGFLLESGVILRAPKEGVEELREEFERLRNLHNNDWAEVAKGLRAYYATFDEDDPRLPLARYTKVDERGPYRTDRDPSWPGGGGPRYDVPHPVTGRPCKVPSRGWVWPTYARMQEEIAKGNIVFGPDETTTPGVRSTIFESDQQVMRSVIFSYAQKATQDLQSLFDGEKVFDNPKSHVDLERLIRYMSRPGDIVLDFFAGSGTTAHSVMVSNQSGAENRRFIMVQLPEALDPSNKSHKPTYAFLKKNGKSLNLAELTKERLRRAGAKVRADNSVFANDIGFRVFKLAASNLKVWDPNPNDLQQMMLDQLDHLVPGRTEQDLLFEVLLKRGVDLCSPIDAREIAGKTVYTVGGVLFACLGQEITSNATEALALGIVEWRKELDPATDSTVVFRDSAFADDVAKANTTEILKQHGFVKVESL